MLTLYPGVGETMDASPDNRKEIFEHRWAHFGKKKSFDISKK